MGETKALLKLPHTAGPDRITTLTRLADLASSTHAALSHINLGPSNALIGPLARQRTKFSNELNQVRTTLVRTAGAANAGVSILKGPQQYLLMTSNNSEMRSGSGAFLEAGIVATDDGNLHFEGLCPVRPSRCLSAWSIGGDLGTHGGTCCRESTGAISGSHPVRRQRRPGGRMWRPTPASTCQRRHGVDVWAPGALDVTGPAHDVQLEWWCRRTAWISCSCTTSTSARATAPTPPHRSTRPVLSDQLGSLASAVMQALETKPLAPWSTRCRPPRRAGTSCCGRPIPRPEPALAVQPGCRGIF